MMRFRLSQLFWAIGITAGICATVFVAPLALTMFLLGFTLAISPAVWITGAIFARGLKRAFFIGGLSSAFVPHIVMMYYSLLIVPSSISEVETIDWFKFGINQEGELFTYRITAAICWLVPGLFAVGGGLLAALTHWLVVEPTIESNSPNERNINQDSNAGQTFPDRSRILDRQVISGRLETVSFDEIGEN